MKIYCQTNKQLIPDYDCVVRVGCKGCNHLSRAKKNKACVTSISDISPAEDKEARMFQTNSHFSDRFMSEQ